MCAWSLISSRVHPGVEEHCADIITWTLLVAWCSTDAVTDWKPQHCWCRSIIQISAAKTRIAASVAQFFCCVYGALLSKAMIVSRSFTIATLAGCKSRANAFLLVWSHFFSFLLFYLLPSIGWLCGVEVFGLIVFSLSPGLAQRTPNNNNNYNNNNASPVTLINYWWNCGEEVWWPQYICGDTVTFDSKLTF